MKTQVFKEESTAIAWNIATEAISNWEEYVSAPSAPKNYKDPVKIEAYIETAIEQIRQNAHRQVVTAKAIGVELCAYDYRDDKVTLVKCDVDDPRVWEYLNSDNVVHIGYNVKSQLRILAMHFIAQGKSIDLRYLVSHCYDPASLLLGSSEVGSVSFELLLKRIFGKTPHGHLTENLVELWKLYG